MVPSGIRLGSPAMTTRGFKEKEAELVANLIADVLDAPENDAVLNATQLAVEKLCQNFPVYGS